MASNISNVNVITSAKDAGAISLMQRLQNESKQTADAVAAISKRMEEIGNAAPSGGGGGLLGSLLGGAGGIVPTIDVVDALRSAFSFISSEMQKYSEAMGRVDNRGNMAEVLGFTYEQIQALSVGATLANTSITSLDGAFARFLKTVSEAASGSEAATQDLGRLGITIADLNGLTSYEILGVVADRLNAIQSPADRARAAMELFGKEAGIKMVQILGGGSQSLEMYTEQARQMGLVLSEAEVAQIKLNKSMLDLDQLAKDGMTEGAVASQELAAGIEIITNWLGKAKNEAVDATAVLSKLAVGFGINFTLWDSKAFSRLMWMQDVVNNLNASGGAPSQVDNNFVGPTLPAGELERRGRDEQTAKNNRELQLRYAKDLADYNRRMDAYDEEQLKKHRDLQFKYARDVADYNRRLDAIDAQNEQNRIDALSRARSDIAGAYDNKPELIMSGSAESQRLAFEAKNSKAREQAMQLAEQQRATVILKEIEANQRRSAVISLGGI